VKNIRVENVTKHYGSVKAVDTLSFEVKAGEMVTLLGPSGCGKTTTLRLIAGLERADGGNIWVGDRLVSSAEHGLFVEPEKRGMGMVFQSYALWPHMTVYENVAYPLKRHKLAAREIPDRVAAVLQTVGMAAYRNRPAPLLSGGQAQRVALARALVFNPDVLLLDEPLSNLDARLREEMRFELRMLQTRLGVTAVFVTHDQAEAMVLSDHTIVMSMGRIEQVGSPSEIYERPATRFVMDFVGQVNYLPARATRQADGMWVAVVPDAGGSTFPMLDERPWKVDEDLVLAFRPQDVALRPAQNGDSRWVGTVQTVAYLGTHVEYVFRLGGADLRVSGPCHGRLAAGEMAHCEIDRTAVRAWPAA
jgi:iron(III) transport system ATP-binding protein